MLNTQRLNVLHQLKQRGTLSRVAEALSYSPSAISQQLTQLEAEAGVTLLEPAGRGVRLTVQGELLAMHAGRILRAIDEAEAELAASSSEVRGQLRVATFQTAALTLLPAVLSELRVSHPNLTVRFTTVQPDLAIGALNTHDFDVILGEEYEGQEIARDTSVKQDDLAKDELRAYMPAGWQVQPRKFEDLDAAPWVMEPRGKPSRAWAEGLCRRAGIEPDVRYESDDLLVHQQLVATGHAVAILPDLMRAQMPASMTSLRLEGGPRRRIFTAVRLGAAGRPDVEEFCAALARALGRQEP